MMLFVAYFLNTLVNTIFKHNKNHTYLNCLFTFIIIVYQRHAMTMVTPEIKDNAFNMHASSQALELFKFVASGWWWNLETTSEQLSPGLLRGTPIFT